MKLTFKERIQLLDFIPGQGDYAKMLQVQAFLKLIDTYFTQDEKLDSGLVIKDGVIVKLTKVLDTEENVTLPPVVLKYLKDVLDEKNRTLSIKLKYVSLYEKIVLPN